MAKTQDNRAKITWYCWGLFILLQLFNLYQLLHHAMWRDELQTWSMVRESGTLPELIHNMRYDGFPPLWYICLWFFSRFTAAPLAMQLFHFTCSFAAQLLVMTRAPFTVGIRLAVIAGYYFSFEYCVISRAYVLGVLLVIVACAYRTWLETRPLLRAFVWGTLANTSLYGAILSLAFMGDEALSFIRAWRSGHDGRQFGWRVPAGFLTIYGILFGAAVACMLQPADGTYMRGWNLHPSLMELVYPFFLNLVFLVPIPLARPTFWNTLALIDFSAFQLWMIIPSGAAILCLVWLALRSSPRYLLLFMVGVVGIWIFTFLKFYGFVRHMGAEMVLFVACIWLSAAERGAGTAQGKSWAIRLILGLNILAFGMASYYHLRYHFSGSREMARVIEKLGPGRSLIVADADYAASPVAGYLNAPLYYPSNRKAQTYIRWNRERTGGGIHDALAFAGELSAGRGLGVLLLLNYPLESGPVRFLASTSTAIVDDEIFYLYEYQP